MEWSEWVVVEEGGKQNKRGKINFGERGGRGRGSGEIIKEIIIKKKKKPTKCTLNLHQVFRSKRSCTLQEE